ncbi:MAG: response regulator [Chloroflexi bacterium]|nr:response regulator [Chloroflexota bacterium]
MTLEGDAKARHELRTPIKMILGYCEVLLNTPPSLPDVQRASIEVIYRNAQALNTLIDKVPIVPSPTPSTNTSQIIVLDAVGALYEFVREYLVVSTLIHVSTVEELGRLGPEVQPSAMIIGGDNEHVIPLITQLIGKNIPILSLSFQAAQRSVEYLTKPVQFDDLEAILQRLGGIPRDVLIVDDSRDNVDLLSRMLASLPAPPHILKAYSGREALALIEAQTPSLILLDLLLPDMDGFAIRDYLRLDARYADIPIVFISAHSSDDMAAPSRASRIALYQMNAASPVKLSRQIQALLAAILPNR